MPGYVSSFEVSCRNIGVNHGSVICYSHDDVDIFPAASLLTVCYDYAAHECEWFLSLAAQGAHVV